uniref:Integrase catalytic domain-containing protein n=1 Tax=Anopheles atroparvus TaxID=41427 RepID=A0AAG5DVF4_ANOAO
MQKLWSVRPDGKALDWDSALPSHLEHEWKKFHSTLSSLRELKVPRFVAQRNALKSQLHIFADASQEAYGACCYVRTESPSGSSVVLLTAKSKVVSLKNAHSIARLELCAARLATRLVQKVSLSLEVPLTFFYWTDSSTVLHWLKSPPRRWKPFVANRVAQIQRDSEITCWRHIPGVDNPADDISRGLSPDTLLECQRWWHGPHWLSLGAEHWPQGGAESEEEIDLSDERNIPQLVATTVNGSDVSAKLFERFSSYLKLQRATAYWLRYFDCLKNAGTDCGSTRCATTIDPLTKDELQRAELKLCKLSQQISFAEEIQILQAGSDVSRGSRLKWLSPFVDASGVLRVGGRLRNAQLDIATKHPIVLSSKHPLASLLVEAYHTKLLHAGPQLLLATLRNKFWILGGRSLCKTVFHRCVKCFKVKPTLVKQSVADLPTSRVSPSRPFSVCGVDYCGPVMLKSAIRNRSATKAYIAIFVCFATRAVHIELVHDLTTTAFLSALRRFVARRGQIREIHSDNATTFKGAAHDLHRV